ncbi:hypothetical protein ACIBLA_36460 [Streptomyces sp. NPDC050433]|uniref:hypothetical protein n=1 Tax=Streptomyces sp. NPDC050433 TaxID=3365615 RepID=UPI00378BF351
MESEVGCSLNNGEDRRTAVAVKYLMANGHGLLDVWVSPHKEGGGYVQIDKGVTPRGVDLFDVPVDLSRITQDVLRVVERHIGRGGVGKGPCEAVRLEADAGSKPFRHVVTTAQFFRCAHGAVGSLAGARGLTSS